MGGTMALDSPMTVSLQSLASSLNVSQVFKQACTQSYVDGSMLETKMIFLVMESVKSTVVYLRCIFGYYIGFMICL